MAGPVLDSQLSGTRSSRVEFRVATQADDAGIRCLLRENPMRGAITLTLEREPDYFADAGLPGEEKQTVVACELGRVVCAGSCTVRPRFVNGEKCRVGYLSGLRLDANVSGRFDILCRGYQFFRELHAESPADYYFTSIAADNHRARNFLERGISGMPAYEYINDFVTLLLPTRQRKRNTPGLEHGTNAAGFIAEVCDFLNRQGSYYQFAPHWSPDDLMALQKLGLSMDNFRVLRRNSEIIASAALWDQRRYKQTVIRGYTPWLARLRPAINIAARFTRIPRLPDTGGTLAHAFVSHFATVSDNPCVTARCMDAMLGLARTAGADYVAIGFDSTDFRLPTIQAQFRGRRYESRIYSVRWPGMRDPARSLKIRALAPEVALL